MKKVAGFFDWLHERGWDVEPDELQEMAVLCGLLVEEPHAQPCAIDACPCDGEFTVLFREGPTLKALRA